MNNEELKLLTEMKDNCLNGAKYIDPKSMEKYNLLRKLEDRLNNWNELKKWLQERKFVYNITGEDLDEDTSITEVLVKMCEIES